MADATDPAIKLFGRAIPLADGPPPRPPPPEEEKDTCEEITCTEIKDSTSTSVELDQCEPNSSSCLNDDNENSHPTSTQDNKATPDVKPEHDQTDGDTSGQDKVLKKPDKILPCPRCKSMDTKFCYYNNYNVNQPRHFCKNCQRYWTAGGTMRNVPVGAGRRKNKHSASHCRQMLVSSDALSSTLNAPDSSRQVLPCVPLTTRPSNGNGTVLKFGPEAPLSESMASVLNLREQESNDPTPMVCGDNNEEPSCASSVTAANCAGNGFSENLVHTGKNSFPGYCHAVTPMNHLQCYPGHPWPYPWISGWNNIAAAAAAATAASMPPSHEVAHGQENSSPVPIPWSGLPIMGAPAFCTPIPFPFVPPPWGCMPVWAGGKWSLPSPGAYGGLSQTSSIGNGGSQGNVSPNLGKHSRDTSSLIEEKTGKSLWIPKTLRIDDPDEASKSSIWATLGIKPDVSRIFKDLKSKTQGKVQASEATHALCANPAALSRSQSFQEST